MKKSGISNIEQYVIYNMKEKRIKFDLTQVDLAVMLKKSSGFIGNFENLKFRANYILDPQIQLEKIFESSPRTFMQKERL